MPPRAHAPLGIVRFRFPFLSEADGPPPLHLAPLFSLSGVTSLHAPRRGLMHITPHCPLRRENRFCGRGRTRGWWGSGRNHLLLPPAPCAPARCRRPPNGVGKKSRELFETPRAAAKVACGSRREGARRCASVAVSPLLETLTVVRPFDHHHTTPAHTRFLFTHPFDTHAPSPFFPPPLGLHGMNTLHPIHSVHSVFLACACAPSAPPTKYAHPPPRAARCCRAPPRLICLVCLRAAA